MTPPINYLDSSVILSYQIGPADRFYPAAKKIMEEDLAGGKAVGLVSMLTLMEIIDVIRRRITERTNRSTLDAMDEISRTQFIRAETDKRIKTLIKVLTSMEKQGFIVFADFTPLDLKQVMENVYDYSRNYFGTVRKYYTCSICRSPIESYSYKGLGWIDLMHAFLAVGLCADGLITADRSFGSLTTDMKFSSLHFIIL